MIIIKQKKLIQYLILLCLHFQNKFIESWLQVNEKFYHFIFGIMFSVKTENWKERFLIQGLDYETYPEGLVGTHADAAFHGCHFSALALGVSARGVLCMSVPTLGNDHRIPTIRTPSESSPGQTDTFRNHPAFRIGPRKFRDVNK